MQNLTPYFDFLPPHCLFTTILLYFWGTPKKIYGCLLVWPLMLKRNRGNIF